MELLKIGTVGRKSRVTPNENVKRDKYNMEDVDEFFADETDLPISLKLKQTPDPKQRKNQGQGLGLSLLGLGKVLSIQPQKKPPKASPSSRLLNIVARKIDFTEAEAESFHFTPPVLFQGRAKSKSSVGENALNKNESLTSDIGKSRSKSAKADSEMVEVEGTRKTKKSPLRSPLQERQRLAQQREEYEEENDDAHLYNNDNDFDDDIYEEDHNTALLPIAVESITADSRGASLTKGMALGNSKKRRPPPRIFPSQNSQENELEDSIDIESEEDTSIAEPKPFVGSADLDDGFDTPVIKKIFLPTATRKPYSKVVKPSPLPSPPPDGLRRSKRTKIPPVAFWKGERVFYTRSNENNDADTTLANDIRLIPLQEIGGVEQPTTSSRSPPARRRTKTKSRVTAKRTAKRTNAASLNNHNDINDSNNNGVDGHIVNNKRNNRKVDEYDYESDPEIPGSEWYKDDLLSLNVFYEPHSDKKGQRKIAWAPNAGNFQKPADSSDPSKQENIMVATLFDEEKSFVATGMLRLPQNAIKQLSRTMDNVYVFHVIKGLLEVVINDSVFVVTKGSSFNVPRNNLYAMKNIGMIEAKVFFVQAKEVASNGGEEDETNYVWD